MAIEQATVDFLDWLVGPYGTGAWFSFVMMVAALILAGTFLGFLFQAVRMGPGEAFFAVAGAYANFFKDLANFSFRRTSAMASLAFQEAMRQKVLVVFAVVAVLMMLGGWFLDVESDDPARLYLGNVLWGTNILALLLAVLLSAFSIPNDIKNKTITTVVTKPVRYLEMLMGRVIGFTAIGTVMLIGLCAVNLIFVERGMMHEHTVLPEDVKDVYETVDDGAGGLDQLARGDALVAGEVVHDDDVSRLERWRQDVADIGLEPLAVDRSVQHHRRDHAAQPQARDQCGGLAVAMREAHAQPGAARTPPVAARHVGGRPGLVDEDQPRRVEIGLGVEPGAPLLQDVRTVLLDRMPGLFSA